MKKQRMERIKKLRQEKEAQRQSTEKDKNKKKKENDIVKDIKMMMIIKMKNL